MFSISAVKACLAVPLVLRSFFMTFTILGIFFSDLATAAPCSSFSSSVARVGGEYFSRKALRVYDGSNKLQSELYLEAANPIREPSRILGSFGEGVLVTQHSTSHFLLLSAKVPSSPQHFFDARLLLRQARPEASDSFYQREITGFSVWSDNEFVLELTESSSLEAQRRVPSLERDETLALLELSDEERSRSVLSLKERQEILRKKKLERGLRQLGLNSDKVYLKVRLVDSSKLGDIAVSLVGDLASSPQALRKAEILNGHLDFFEGKHFGYWREGLVYQILTGSQLFLEVKNANDYDSKGNILSMSIPGKKVEAQIEDHLLHEKMLITSDEKQFYLMRIRIEPVEKKFFFDAFALEKPKGNRVHASLPILGQNTTVFIPLSPNQKSEDTFRFLQYDLPNYDPSRTTILQVKPSRLELQGIVDAWNLDSLGRSFAIESSRSVYRFKF